METSHLNAQERNDKYKSAHQGNVHLFYSQMQSGCPQRVQQPLEKGTFMSIKMVCICHHSQVVMNYS